MYTDIDECAESNPCDHTCMNTVGSFTCGCTHGYMLTGDTQCEGESVTFNYLFAITIM